MDSIRAEQVRQAIASQGGAIQAQPVYFKTAPIACDSYARQNVKSGIGFFPKLLALGAAIIFDDIVGRLPDACAPKASKPIKDKTKKDTKRFISQSLLLNFIISQNR